MLHDADLIPLAADYSITGHEQAEAHVLDRLDACGASRLVIAARMLTMRATILATGTVSVFEALLQQSLGWHDRPLEQLDEHLRAHDLEDLAERFLDYRYAINVLKHGAGKSHDRLLARKGRLDFEVRPVDQPFHDEGDISEVSTLVRADAPFVRSCARLIAQITEALRNTIPGALL